MKTQILTTALIIFGFAAPVQAQDAFTYRRENPPYPICNQIIANLTAIVLKEYLRTIE